MGHQRGEKHGLTPQVLSWKGSLKKRKRMIMETAGLRDVYGEFVLEMTLCPTFSRSLVSCGHILPLHSHSLSSWTHS